MDELSILFNAFIVFLSLQNLYFESMIFQNWVKQTLYHFLFFTVSFVTYFALVLAFVVNTFFVSYFPTVAKPWVLPVPFFPFFLYPFLCHFGNHLSVSALNPSVGLSKVFGYLGLLFFFILFFKGWFGTTYFASPFLPVGIMVSTSSSFLMEMWMFFSICCR